MLPPIGEKVEQLLEEKKIEVSPIVQQRQSEFLATELEVGSSSFYAIDDP